MVGDTMETDIRGALELGFHAVLTLSGSTRPELLPRYPYRPTLVVESIAELDLQSLHKKLAQPAATDPAPVPLPAAA
jgi:NagD protein